jgi:hypothetical protein
MIGVHKKTIRKLGDGRPSRFGIIALGPPVTVTIPRPRDRKTVNHDARFKAVRNQVIEYLLGPGRRRGAADRAAAPVALANASSEAARGATTRSRSDSSAR